MKKVFYEKVGSKYIPVSEYSSELSDSFTPGCHMIVVSEGSYTRRYNIDPDRSAMIAAGIIAEHEIVKVITEKSSIRLSADANRSSNTLTPEQAIAWDNLITAFGESGRRLEWPSAHEVAQAALQVLQDQAAKLLDNASVKKAHDNLVLVAKLSASSTLDS